MSFMKSFFLILFLITNELVGLAQVLPNQWIFTNYQMVEPLDSTILSVTSRNIYNPHSNKKYFHEWIFTTSKADSISISLIGQDVIFYLHYSASKALLYCGELKIDPSKIIRNSVRYRLQDGTDSIAYDTAYLLVPNGEWYIKKQGHFYESVNFKNGFRNGVSLIKIQYPGFPESISLISSVYEMDVLKKSDTLKLPDYKTIKTELTGEWYHPYFFYSDNIENPLWIFQRQKPSSIPQTNYFKSTLQKNGKYSIEIAAICSSDEADMVKNSNQKWTLITRDEIRIADVRYKIIFFNKDYFVLEALK